VSIFVSVCVCSEKPNHPAGGTKSQNILHKSHQILDYLFSAASSTAIIPSRSFYLSVISFLNNQPFPQGKIKEGE
jgi:hypothetical protein